MSTLENGAKNSRMCFHRPKSMRWLACSILNLQRIEYDRNATTIYAFYRNVLYDNTGDRAAAVQTCLHTYEHWPPAYAHASTAHLWLSTDNHFGLEAVSPSTRFIRDCFQSPALRRARRLPSGMFRRRWLPLPQSCPEPSLLQSSWWNAPRPRTYL